MVCWDVEKTGSCPRKFCKWCGTATKTSGAIMPVKGGKGKWSGKWDGEDGELMKIVMGKVGYMKGYGKKGKGKGSSGKFQIDDSGGILGEFLGTIKSFNDWKCYGFIECDDIKAQGYQDVFLHGDQKRGYQVGHKVKFTAFLTAEGKCQAKDLKSGLK
mmetsp:Transcript_118138/g.329407  ORF Transcript_118138/g.329407 Transcript_118138/m.329407 type:complete len:158 (-) Transcript_118138:98-571(-)